MVLISNTMSTLVAEQTREIAVMRAVGARRRQVAVVYLRTTLLLGAVGALLGTALGITLSSLLARSFGATFWAVDVTFGVDVNVLLVSMLVGLSAPPLAALPAIRRGLRVDLREALEASGSALGGQDAADRLLRRATFLPRAMQIGLRNTGRRNRRSLATAAIVALAVANLLAVLALASTATEATRTGWGNHLEDLQISTGGRALLDERAERAIRATPGVTEAEPVLKNAVELAGQEAVCGLWNRIRSSATASPTAAGSTPASRRTTSGSRSSSATSPRSSASGSAIRSLSRPPSATPTPASSASSRTSRSTGRRSTSP